MIVVLFVSLCFLPATQSADNDSFTVINLTGHKIKARATFYDSRGTVLSYYPAFPDFDLPTSPTYADKQIWHVLANGSDVFAPAIGLAMSDNGWPQGVDENSYTYLRAGFDYRYAPNKHHIFLIYGGRTGPLQFFSCRNQTHHPSTEPAHYKQLLPYWNDVPFLCDFSTSQPGGIYEWIPPTNFTRIGDDDAMKEHSHMML